VDRDHLAIGRLGAPKGVRGDLKLHSYSGESAHFLNLKEVELRDEEGLRSLKLKVARIEKTGDSLSIAFTGYPTPEAARALTGMDIVVPRSEAAPLGENEWYTTDLVGLDLVDTSGQKIATVRSVLEGGPDPWLEVVVPAAQRNVERVSQRNALRISLVPFRKEFVGEVDLKAGTIELLAPWLLEE
jgi:16S rRNA processing protein RimM